MIRGKSNQGDLLKRVFSLATILVAGGFSGMIGCGGGGGAGDANVSAQSTTTSVGVMNPGSVANVPFGSSGSARVSFSNLTGTEQFVVSFQSHTTTQGTYSTGISGSESDLGSLRSSLVTSLDVSNQVSNDPMEATEAFHEMLRREEANIPFANQQDTKLSMSAGGGSLRGYISTGEVLSVQVLNSLSSTSSFTTIACNIRVITDHFIACRDSNDAGSLSDSNMQILMNHFEANANEQFATYGSVSDVDDNGKVITVFSSVINELAGAGGGIVTGYFYAGDLYSGNNGEYIFCHVPSEVVNESFYMSNTGPNCMPHELQHAINYNMRAFVNETSTEPSPMNEGGSHLAEHLFGNNNENPSRVNLYFGSNLASFMGGTSLSQRGGSYLFLRYIYEQADNGRFSGVASGNALIRSMLDRSETGLEAVVAATGENIDTILSDFFTALYLSNTGLSSDTRFNFSGINLRSEQNDNRFTVLDGPTVQSASSLPVSGSVLAISSNYSLITGSQIQANGNEIGLSASSSSDPFVSLIRIGDR